MKHSAMDAVTGADALVILTDWPEFTNLSLEAVAGAMTGRLVVDGRNLLDPAAVAAAGLVYLGVGRRTRLPQPRALEPV